jgi:hypothetical protein
VIAQIVVAEGIVLAHADEVIGNVDDHLAEDRGSMPNCEPCSSLFW